MGLRCAQAERFAVLVGTGAASELDAYVQAFGASNQEAKHAAPELLRDPNVTERIRQAQEALLRETATSEGWLLLKLKDAIQGAYDKGQYATVIKGVELAGRHKALQLFPQRVDHHKRVDPFEGMTREQLLAEAVKVGLIEGERDVTPEPAAELPAQVTQ